MKSNSTNAKMGKVEKHYSKLTGQERIALVINAIERGDEAEAIRLRDSCPRETFSWWEASYRKHYAAMRELGRIFRDTIFLEGTLFLVHTTHTMRDPEGLPEVRLRAARIRCIREGFEQLCQSLRVTPHGVWKLTGGPADEALGMIFEVAEGLLKSESEEHLKLEAEAVAADKEYWMNFWRKLLSEIPA